MLFPKLANNLGSLIRLHPVAALLWTVGWAGLPLAGHTAVSSSMVIAGTAVIAPTNQIARHACNSFNVVLSNVSGQNLTGLSATLATTTPGVEITQPKSLYPDLPPGGTGMNGTPFSIGVAVSFACGTPIDLTLTITSTNGSTDVIAFQQGTPANCLVGASSCAVTNSYYAGITSTDRLQTGRLIRRASQNPSTCASPTPCPGPYSAENPPLPRRCDPHHLFNGSGETTCITVELIVGCMGSSSAQLFSAAYLDRFDPANLCANYLADIGRSPNPNIPPFSVSYSFYVPPDSHFVVVVNEINPGQGCTNYTLKISSPAGFVGRTPILEISRQGPSVLVSWPTNVTGYWPESAPALPFARSESSFASVTNLPAVVGEDYHITNSPGEPQRFYRLRRRK